MFKIIKELCRPIPVAIPKDGGITDKISDAMTGQDIKDENKALKGLILALLQKDVINENDLKEHGINISR